MTNSPDPRPVDNNAAPCNLKTSVAGQQRSNAEGPTVITSESLFAGANEVQIEHQGILYRLRRTSLGKLILTK
jgi:hemin uptake protein HemP